MRCVELVFPGIRGGLSRQVEQTRRPTEPHGRLVARARRALYQVRAFRAAILRDVPNQALRVAAVQLPSDCPWIPSYDGLTSYHAASTLCRTAISHSNRKGQPKLTPRGRAVGDSNSRPTD